MQGKRPEELPCCDCSLVGLSWMGQGRDLRLEIEFPDGRTKSLVHTWVAGMRCELAYSSKAGGPPLSWDVSYGEEGDRQVAIWDFAHLGELRFTFEDAYYAEDDG